MDLLLWRHAEAVDGIPDNTRELTERGLRQAHKVAEWLDSRRPKKLRVLVSPTTRTRQTASAFTQASRSYRRSPRKRHRRYPRRLWLA
jgi:phosphohistidine phosphatase